MMMRLLLFLILSFFTQLLASESLMTALTQGKFSGEIDANYASGSTEEGNYDTRHSTIYLEYTLPEIKGIDFKVATESQHEGENHTQKINKIVYGEAIYANRTDTFDYTLSANYYSTLYTPDADTQTVTSRAVGLKAQIDVEHIQAYAAISQVSDSAFATSSHPSLQGTDTLLPTASLLLSKNDTPNTRAAALDVRYLFNKTISLGSRYSVAEDEKSMTTYNGIYSSIMLHDVLKGLQMTLAYDQVEEGPFEKQWSVQFKSKF